MIKFDSDKYESDPEYRNKCLQETFRRQAQRDIDKTLKNLDRNNKGNFAERQKAAFDRTMSHFKTRGIIDRNGKPTKLTKSKFDSLFKIYYEKELKDSMQQLWAIDYVKFERN